MKKITKMRSFALLLFAGMMSTAMADVTVSDGTTSTSYADLSTAIAACTSTTAAYTITVNSDQVIGKAIKTETGTTISMVPNGDRTITRTAAIDAIECVGTSLTIDGSAGSFTFDGGSGISGKNSFFKVGTASCNLYLQNITIKNVTATNYSNAAIRESDGKAYITNVTFENCNNTDNGSAVFVSAGRHIYVGGTSTFTNCANGDVALEAKTGSVATIIANPGLTATNRIKIKVYAQYEMTSGTKLVEKGTSDGVDTKMFALAYHYYYNSSAKTGEYKNVFTLNKSNNNLVTANGITAIMTSAGWGTLQIPIDSYSGSIDGLTAYSCSALNDAKDAVSLVEVPTLSGHTPYIIKGTEGFYPIYGTVAAQTDQATVGYLVGTEAAASVSSTGNNYVLQNQSGNVAFYKVTTDDITINPYHCYLAVTSSANSIALDLNNVVTGISELKATSSSDAPLYNVSGMRVQNASKGLYIQNGKLIIK